MTDRTRVVVVTGGGGGIGAAIAESIGRAGAFVVTVDPMVSVDGAEQLPAAAETTAGRIVAAGGAARASNLSVTDEAGMRMLFGELANEFGGLDAVVNVAGISRPTSFTTGSRADWHDVLAVHLDGYRNVLAAALPLMADAGRGHILGVTSGSGWRSADAGAYGCAKRAVAALTWELGRHAPEGVVVNAISPIAATRMVAAAMGGKFPTKGASTGGLSLGSMPAPEHLGPLGAHLVDAGFDACRGRVIFAAGSEVAVIDRPRLIEAVRCDDLPGPHAVMEAAATLALVPAEAAQVSTGASNARFGSTFDEAPHSAPPTSAVRTCAIASDDPAVGAGIATALGARGVTSRAVGSPSDLDLDDVDAIVVATADGTASTAVTRWQRILAEHAGLVDRIDGDAPWARAAADLAASRGHSVRLVIATGAVTSGGRSRAQAAAQLTRAGRKATRDGVLPFSVSVESPRFPTEFVALLACSPAAAELAGAELVSGAGWFGLRSHPRPAGSISFGGPSVPSWFDDTLREVTP